MLNKFISFSLLSFKTEISKAFNVSGIPALIFINGANCELITNDGRSIVTEDVDGEDFPWLPIPMNELLDGDFVKVDGTVVPYDTISDNILGILFAAQWVFSSNNICNIK